MADTSLARIGFGGGCHWCTEGIFQSLIGVDQVDQGWISSDPPDDSFSEAVIVHADLSQIPLHMLIDIHLRTHSSMSNHTLRGKYRSAVYVFNDIQHGDAQSILDQLAPDFPSPLVTRILAFRAFKPSDERFQNYYQKNAEGPFCRSYIDPKLAILRSLYRSRMRPKAG